MQSYPFTSQVTYDDQGLPLYDRAVDSKFLRKVYAQYWSDGVFYKPATALQVVADTGMQVAVEPGVCHIQGAMGIEPNRRILVVQAAEAQDRIDTVVARLDLSVAVRSIDLYVRKGTAADSPQAPALTRDSTTWEIGLANLFIARNTATISQQRITDTRLDTTRCGLVAQTVGELDTAPYFAQLMSQIEAHQEAAESQIQLLQEAIQSVESGTAWMMRTQYDPDDAGIDITVQTYTHSRSGSVHNLAGQGANGRVQLTADVQAGNTWTVNGEPVKAYMGAADATETMAGESYSGKWLSFIYADGTVNFKGGGGGSVTVSGLSAATVKAGSTVTVKQGAKTVQSVSGTFTRDATAAAANILAGKTAYVNGNKVTGTMPDRGQSQYGNFGSGNGYVAINGLPEGYYWSGGASWAPEARLSNSAMAAGIGLTAAKLLSGNTILGISGTAKDLISGLQSAFSRVGGGGTSISVTSGKTYLVWSSWSSANWNQTMLNSGVNGGNILSWWSSTGAQAGVTGYWVQMAVIRATSGTMSFESSGNGLFYTQLD